MIPSPHHNAVDERRKKCLQAADRVDRVRAEAGEGECEAEERVEQCELVAAVLSEVPGRPMDGNRNDHRRDDEHRSQHPERDEEPAGEFRHARRRGVHTFCRLAIV